MSGQAKYTQIRTILNDMNYDSLCEVFQRWILYHTPIEEGDWVVGDACPDTSVGKLGEGSSLQELLAILKDKGVIITLDALHCQKKQLI